MKRLKLKPKPAQRERLKRCNITLAFAEKSPLMERGQFKVWDEHLKGFGLLIGMKRKTYFVERFVRAAGDQTSRTRFVKIGHHPDYTPDQARAKAKEFLRLMEDGIDPRDERKREQQRAVELQRSQVTLQQLWDEFKAHRTALKPSTLKGYERLFRPKAKGKKDSVFHDWLERPIKSITGEDVLKRHAMIGKTHGKPDYANLSMRVLQALLSHAEGRGWLSTNPVSMLKKTRSWFPARRRQNIIKPHQFPAWFNAIAEVRKLTDPAPSAMVCDYLEFVLFTGLRKEEAASLPWANVDLKQKTITIPDTKNKQPHVLPLTPHLITILGRRKKEGGESEWVFPAQGLRKGRGHLSEPRYVAKLVQESSGVVFSIHDLRRTFITTADRLDLPYYAVKRLVNHKMSGDVTAGYVIKDHERLIEPMQRITNYLLAKAVEPETHKLKIAQ